MCTFMLVSLLPCEGLELKMHIQTFNVSRQRLSSLHLDCSWTPSVKGDRTGQQPIQCPLRLIWLLISSVSCAVVCSSWRQSYDLLGNQLCCCACGWEPVEVVANTKYFIGSCLSFRSSFLGWHWMIQTYFFPSKYFCASFGFLGLCNLPKSKRPTISAHDADSNHHKLR